jgi:hypothetical protein
VSVRRALVVAPACLLVFAAAARAGAGRPTGCAERASREPKNRRAHWHTDIDPNLYVNSLDTMVTYDNQLNQRDYDDGYEPDAYKPFLAALATHGTWADTARLGRVWFPSPSETGTSFVPYATNGHWAFTDYGWTWISDWSWGWAPFHYGRWAVLPGRGWCWIPGTLWGPAWVAWRSGRNYVAWAPLPPEGMSIGRPLGPRSPWSMARAQTFGTKNIELVPRRVLPSLFARTTALSNPRAIALGAFTVETNAGPTRLPCCLEGAPRPLADFAPELAPRSAIHPYSGVALESRPWVQHRFVTQTPICRWSADDDRDAGPCVVATSNSSGPPTPAPTPEP